MPEQEEEGRIRFVAGDDFTDVPRIPDSFLAPQDAEKGSDDVVCEYPTPILGETSDTYFRAECSDTDFFFSRPKSRR